MRNKIKNEILYISQSILDDEEYDKVLKYLDRNRINDLRSLINEKMEFYNIISVIDNEDELLRTQLELCNELENIIITEFTDNIEM